MTAHHRYSEQVLLEAQLLKMVLGWHSQRKETENIKKKKKKNPPANKYRRIISVEKLEGICFFYYFASLYLYFLK